MIFPKIEFCIWNIKGCNNLKLSSTGRLKLNRRLFADKNGDEVIDYIKRVSGKQQKPEPGMNFMNIVVP